MTNDDSIWLTASGGFTGSRNGRRRGGKDQGMTVSPGHIYLGSPSADP